MYEKNYATEVRLAAKNDGPRETASEETRRLYHELADRVEVVIGRLASKMDSVVQASQATLQAGELAKASEYPPLFSELRKPFMRIHEAMDRADDLMDRCEL